MSELDEEDLVEVVLDDAPARAGGIWTYAVPPELRGQLGVGRRVEVPFGGRVMEGTVVGPGRPPQRGQVRPVLRLVPGRASLPAELVHLGLALAEIYLCPPAAGLRAVAPPSLRVAEEPTVHLLVSPRDMEGRVAALRSPRVRRVAARFLAAPGRRTWPLADLEETWDEGQRALLDALRQMARQGLLRVVRSRRPTAAPRAPESAGGAPGEAEPPRWGGAEITLLLGGDTRDRAEVYLGWVEEVLSRGGGAVVAAPEVGQVERVAGWWRPRLGDKLAVLHAGLTPARRQAAWLALAGGGARVALGTRSVLFAPVSRPHLVIVEREHDEAYKQEETPRYQAATVAALRATERVVLGSATPRVETFFRAERGEYGLRELPRGALPPVTVVDLRPAAGGARRGHLSGPLKAALARVVARRQRAVLFLNRRGYAGALACRECGQTLGCPRCRISLVYHRPGGMYCHLCGFSRPVPDLCPFCGGRELALIGVGTQRVEQEVGRLVPGTPVFRLDTDAAGRPQEVRGIWEAFLERRPAVLVGTRMVTGVPEFPDLGLVGVVNADVGLHLPDFRAAERTFSLLYELGEMAADWGGEMVIQTYQPDHHALRALRSLDYVAFYREEIALREELRYPPFSYLVRLICAAPREEEARRGVEDVCRRLPGVAGLEVLGPAPAPLSPLKGVFRWVALLKGARPEETRAALREALGRSGVEGRRGLRLTVDVDPYDML